jgi:hypothetical protein
MIGYSKNATGYDKFNFEFEKKYFSQTKKKFDRAVYQSCILK